MGLPSIPWRSSLAALLLTAAPALPAAAAAPAACPASAVAVLDGLYRWHIAKQNDSGPMLLISQRERFTPELYSQLVQAAALRPGDGEMFLDFDVFSGTQVGTHGASVSSCRSVGPDLEAQVTVLVGLRKREEPQPVVLQYRLVADPTGSWRIADITYRDEPPFRLSEHLGKMLKPKS